MVDFAREQVIDVDGVASRLQVNQVTVRRWFKRGLEWCKLGGKVYTSWEAVNRFRRDGNNSPMVQAIVVDRETLAAIKSLRQQGFKIGSEASTDGGKAKVAVGR